MPLLRKIVDIGGGKAVFLPKSWLQYYEETYGQRIEKIAMEVNKQLKLWPVLLKTKKEVRNYGKRERTRKSISAA